MTNNTIERAHGRWREILPALGLSEAVVSGKHQPCPLCGGKDRFRFTDRNKEGDYFCSQCGAGRGAQLLHRFHGWDFKRVFEEVDRIVGGLPPPSTDFHHTRAASPVACRQMYAASRPVEDDDPAGRYLTSRRLWGPWSRALRYSPMLRHRASGTVQHGLLAVFCDPGGKPATLHRTYLTGTGRKADVDPVRMFMPGRLPGGGAIRLGPASMRLGVAEGIETALSAAALFEMPVWATTSAVMLERWQPPPEARDIFVYGDNDLNFTGQAAAYALANRLVVERQRDGIAGSITVVIPGNAGKDWNDVLLDQHKGELDAAG